MAKIRFHNGSEWEVAGTDADKVELKDNNDLFQANNVEDVLVEIKQDFDTHSADSTAHGIGDKTQLQTTAKDTIVNAINEVFQRGNNVKANTVGALLSVDNSLPITEEDNWQDIINAIGQISTGKKFASGNITLNGTTQNTVSGLDFTPATVICSTSPASNDYYYFVYGSPISYYNTLANRMLVPNSSGGGVMWEGNITPITNGFRITSPHINSITKTLYWCAYGG